MIIYSYTLYFTIFTLAFQDALCFYFTDFYTKCVFLTVISKKRRQNCRLFYFLTKLTRLCPDLLFFLLDHEDHHDSDYNHCKDNYSDDETDVARACVV